MSNRALKACIIGAGCAGFTTAKRLKDYGLAFDCFEASDDIGGNWYYKNPNGASACYASLHIDTSKWRLAFEDFPIPESFPDFPHHAQLLSYFHDYVARFDLRPHIQFNTRVTSAVREDTGDWRVSVSSGESRLYQALFVCNGHHWDPRLPDPYPGVFAGAQMHAHAYRDPFDPIDLRGKNVVVVGAGNSAMDIASELSQKPLAKNLWISMRRGVWVLPKYIDGKPADKASLPAWMPPGLGRALAQRMIKSRVGRMQDYGLPEPDHAPLTAHPSVSGEFLTRVGCGDIKPKPAIKALEGTAVRFVDDSVEPVDVIIYATGYKVSFPFFSQPQFLPQDNRFPLWKRMMQPGVDNLFFMGLAQPLPTLVNFAEQQSKVPAALLAGHYVLPSVAQMRAKIKADERRYLGHFYASPRHTMQLDFNHYVLDLKKELVRGAKRARGLGKALSAPSSP